MKTLIIYFSQTGKTKICAEAITKEISADLREIKLNKPRRGILLYILGGYEALFAKKVDLLSPDYDLSAYGTIILATPTWASRPAPAMFTFASNADFSGKNVLVFTTSMDNPKKIKNTLKPFIEGSGGKLIGTTGVVSFRKNDEALCKEAVEFSTKTTSNIS